MGAWQNLELLFLKLAIGFSYVRVEDKLKKVLKLIVTRRRKRPQLTVCVIFRCRVQRKSIYEQRKPNILNGAKKFHKKDHFYIKVPRLNVLWKILLN